MDDSNQTSKIDRFESTEDILRAVSRIIDQNDGEEDAKGAESAKGDSAASNQTNPVQPARVLSPAPSAPPSPPVHDAVRPSVPPQPAIFSTPAEPPPSQPTRSITKKKFSASPHAAVFRGDKTNTPPNEPSSDVKATTPSEPPKEKILSPPVMQKAEETPAQETPAQETPAVFKKPATKQSVKELSPSPQNSITDTTPCLELTDMIDDNGTIISLPLIGTADIGDDTHEASLKESVVNQLKGKISHLFSKEEKIDDVIELKAKAWLEQHMPQLVEQAVEQAMKKKTNHDDPSKEF